jgi:hypothetical protein
MKKKLNLVHPQNCAQSISAYAETSLQGNLLQIDYEVHCEELNIKEHLSENEFPYQFDVVEAFICFNHDNPAGYYPYFEYEVTPLNQTFQVVVDYNLQKSEKIFNRGAPLELNSMASEEDFGWRAQMKRPLESLPWDQNPASIVGNLYAIVGKGEQRTYWSLFLPQQDVPNFHHPEYFQPLI